MYTDDPRYLKSWIQPCDLAAAHCSSIYDGQYVVPSLSLTAFLIIVISHRRSDMLSTLRSHHAALPIHRRGAGAGICWLRDPGFRREHRGQVLRNVPHRHRCKRGRPRHHLLVRHMDQIRVTSYQLSVSQGWGITQ